MTMMPIPARKMPGLPLVVLGVSVPTSLLAAAWISAGLLLGIVLIGSLTARPAPDQ